MGYIRGRSLSRVLMRGAGILGGRTLRDGGVREALTRDHSSQSNMIAEYGKDAPEQIVTANRRPYS